MSGVNFGFFISGNVAKNNKTRFFYPDKTLFFFLTNYYFGQQQAVYNVHG